MTAREGVGRQLRKIVDARGSRSTYQRYLVDELKLGTLADPERDEIQVDGKRIEAPAGHTYLLVNKPPGYVTTARDELGRPTVMDLAYKAKQRVFPVGRLDLDSEGLLLLTNDGDLAQRLTHPSHEVEKEYLALVRGEPGVEALRRLRHGVSIDGRRTCRSMRMLSSAAQAHHSEITP